MLKQLRIGPIDSGRPEFDIGLRTYLAQNGYRDIDGSGREWQKEFDNPVAADRAAQDLFEQVGRLAVENSPVLPRVISV